MATETEQPAVGSASSTPPGVQAVTRISAQTVLDGVRALAAEFAQQRNERQRRRALDPADFDRLREAGFLLCAVPVEHGGLWEGASRSTRLVCELLRTLAHGDSSVALVAAMHPAVLATAGWLVPPDRAPEPFRGAVGAPATVGLPDGGRRRPVGHDHVRAGQRRRRAPDRRRRRSPPVLMGGTASRG